MEWQWWAEHTVETLLKCEQQEHLLQLYRFGNPWGDTWQLKWHWAPADALWSCFSLNKAWELIFQREWNHSKDPKDPPRNHLTTVIWHDCFCSCVICTLTQQILLEKVIPMWEIGVCSGGLFSLRNVRARQEKKRHWSYKDSSVLRIRTEWKKEIQPSLLIQRIRVRRPGRAQMAGGMKVWI